MTSPEPDSHPHSSFSRDVITLVTGTTFAQIITILFSPIITRFYGPEAFGLLAIFTAITGIFSVILCLRYELAIMLPKSHEEAANVFGLSLFIMVLISILSVPILIFSQNYIEHFLKVSQLGPFFWLLPLSIFLTGLLLVLNYWNVRIKQFHRLAIAQVMSSSATTGTKLGMGFLGNASGGVLIEANILGQLISTVTLSTQIISRQLHFFRQHITVKGMITVLKRYSNFPKFDLWAALLNSFSSSLPIFILSIYFTSTILGYYSIAIMVTTFPIGLIGNAISAVFFQKAAEAKNISQMKLTETVENTIKPLIFLSLFPTILLALIGPQLFGVVFGARWQESGNYARYLSFWVWIVFISAPFSTLISIFQKQKINLLFNIIDVIFRSFALIIGATMIGNASIAIILYATAGVIVNMIPFIYVLRLSEVSLIKIGGIFLKYFILCIPFIIIILLIKYIFSAYNIALVIFSCILLLSYYYFAIKNDNELMCALNDIINAIPIIKKFRYQISFFGFFKIQKNNLQFFSR